MEINFKKCITYKVFVKLLNVMSTLANLRREGVLNDTPMVEMMNFDNNPTFACNRHRRQIVVNL